MGRKKYYCEYCDKTFNDDPKARALHLNSVGHQKLKHDHYNQFKDAKSRLEEELKKEKCFIFHRDGYCRFGNSCRHSHLLPDEIEFLKLQVESENSVAPLPMFYNWWRGQHHGKIETPSIRLSHTVPSNVHLPVSLQPFDIAHYINTDLSQWGNI